MWFGVAGRCLLWAFGCVVVLALGLCCVVWVFASLCYCGGFRVSGLLAFGLCHCNCLLWILVVWVWDGSCLGALILVVL